MEYKRDVKILMGNKAYELLRNNCLASDNETVRDMVNEEKGFSLEKINENTILVGWKSIGWYASHENICCVDDTLQQLEDMVEENPNSLKDNFFKIITIAEDNTTELTNDLGDKFVGDFYIKDAFSM